MPELDSEVQKKLEEFCKNSNKIAPKPSDYEIWEDFIILSHSKALEISNWIYDYLIDNGFEDEIAYDFYNQYRTARNVLVKKGA